MGSFDAGKNQSFRYLQDAREAALQRSGNEAIRRTDDQQYQVVPLPDLESQTEGPNHPLDFSASPVSEQLHALTQKAQFDPKTVEFIIDAQGDGERTQDRRFTVQNGQVQEAEYRLGRNSDLVVSPEQRGLGTLREALQRHSDRLLLNLTPKQAEAVLNSEQLSSEERSYAQEKLGSATARAGRERFQQFFGTDTPLSAAGVQDYGTLMERLNSAQNRQSLDTLYEISRFPEQFREQYADKDTELSSMAHTLEELPGFKRFPTAQSDKLSGDALKDQRRNFDNALRTINQYQYDLRLSQGMQFNRDGVSGYQTRVDYRLGEHIFSAELEGKDYQLGGDWGSGSGLGSASDNAAKRLMLGYSSGSFDLRTGVEKTADGHFKFITPESDAADRYLARKNEQALGWAGKHPWATAGIAAGTLGAVYAYSLANPDQDLAVKFNQRFDLLDREHLRVRAEISPEVHLQGGQPDLGLAGVGLGASGHLREHSYDATIRQRYENTTLRSGEAHAKEAEVNLRYGYRSHSVTLDSRYTYATGQLDSQLGYRKSFVHSANTSSYVQPYLQMQNGQYQNAGLSAGFSHDFGSGLQLQLNADYNQQNGVSGGFKMVKAFDW